MGNSSKIILNIITNMKNILCLLAFTAFGSLINAQVNVNNGTQSLINNSNALIDGSSSYSKEAGAGDYVGKGIIIPSVDLVNFEFDLLLADGTTFPTFFDGMIVYNNATGTTLTTGKRPSTATTVIPGYYYFSNPNGSVNSNVTGGVWKSLGASVVGTGESTTNTVINNAQVYAIKGTFNADGLTTAVTIPIPAGMTALYRITIYKAGGGSVFATGVYSMSLTATTGNVITGSPSMSVVYPVGPYEYVLEYLK